ncbi:MAG TPA: pre-peptidase C-terminal domain-containing protein, partial [Gemmataceae bacterium]|nr:pre-peptidase C-terminal domain-containing protein [Gemmataceae bacterium]
LGGFAETSPPKDLSTALGGFGVKLSEVQLGTVVGGFAFDLNHAELTTLVSGFANDGLTPAQVGQLTTLLGGYLANPPTTTATQLGHFLDTLTQVQLGSVLGGFVEALSAPGLSTLMTGLGSFVITGSGDDTVGGGLLTRFATGAGNDKLFCGPTDPSALTKALQAAGVDSPAIDHLLDTAGSVLAGGKGNDSYYLVGNFLGHVQIKEPFEQGSLDTVDASAVTGGPLVIDLATSAEQTVTKGKLWLTLSDGSGIENFTGGSGADQARGNDQDNVMLGAQPLPVQLAPMATTNAPTQVVFLDFTGVSTTDYSKTHQQHSYTPAERNAILSRMVTAYQGFNYQFTLTKPAAAPFTTIWFNATPGNGLPGGEAKEIDFANLSRNALVVVDVNGFLGGLGQPPIDGDGDAANSIDANLTAMSATIAEHEMGHAVGLRHGDSFGPILFGVHNPPGTNAYVPTFPGPAGALETTWHVMASPLSVGSSLFDAIGTPFFGERELVKLAFADHAPSAAQPGTLIVPEQATLPGGHGTTATAQPLTLLGLAVPNTMSKGFDANKQFVVTAVDVAGQIKLNGSQSESDYYSFTLPQSQNVTIEVMSSSLTRYKSDAAGTIDSVVRIYDGNGQLIAENDDQFEPQDSNLLDLQLAGGTYYVQVDTYTGNGVPHIDTGKYEMLIYTFAAGNVADGNDMLDGRGGNDTLNGDRGNDSVLGGTGDDKLTGFVGDDSFDGGTGADRLVEVGDVNFKLSDSSLTGLGSDKLTSIELATLVGGPSANTIDASKFGGSVVLQGLGGNDTLTGGAGGNILIGGTGDDQLVGASGDDVMIGGAGADRLTGSSGHDLMVAASTNWDYNPKDPTNYTGLLAIDMEWTSNHPIADRMNNILGTTVPGALNRGFYLIPTGSNRTVFDDTSVDTLTGSQGDDWYFVHTKGALTDTITSFGTGDFKQAID